MSVYRINAHNPAHKIEVGWSPRLRTYYAQVHDKAKLKSGQDAVVAWIGGHRREVIDIDDLERRLKPWATIRPKVRTALADDKAGGR